MQTARKKCDLFFAEPHVIVDRIQTYLQGEHDIKIYQEDVAEELGIPPNVLTVLKTRKSQSFLPFAFKWCLENGLDVAKFCER